jgi:hypothetical protein
LWYFNSVTGKAGPEGVPHEKHLLHFVAEVVDDLDAASDKHPNAHAAGSEASSN